MASGVRSSCEALATKSLRICSSWCSAVTSRMMTRVVGVPPGGLASCAASMIQALKPRVSRSPRGEVCWGKTTRDCTGSPVSRQRMSASARRGSRNASRTGRLTNSRAPKSARAASFAKSTLASESTSRNASPRASSRLLRSSWACWMPRSRRSFKALIFAVDSRLDRRWRNNRIAIATPVEAAAKMAIAWIMRRV